MSEPAPTEYRTIRTESPDHLDHEVNEAAKEGWRVVGTSYVPGPYWNEYHATLERAAETKYPG